MKIDFKPENNALTLSIEDVTGVVQGEYELCQLFYLCLWGTFEIKLHNAGFRLDTDLDIGSMKANNGKMVPKLSLENFNAQLTNDDLDFALEGSLNAWVSGIFADLAKWVLLPSVMESVNASVPQLWNSSFSQMMMEYGGMLDTGMGFGLDLSYQSAPLINDHYMELFFNGTVYDTTTGEVIPADAAPTMKVDPDTPDTLQFGIAEQTVTSIAALLSKSGMSL